MAELVEPPPAALALCPQAKFPTLPVAVAPDPLTGSAPEPVALPTQTTWAWAGESQRPEPARQRLVDNNRRAATDALINSLPSVLTLRLQLQIGRHNGKCLLELRTASGCSDAKRSHGRSGRV